jgi:tetratricopeptide (TPR) repeat protein
VIDASNRDAITRAKGHHAADFVALVDICRAVAQGNTADAVAASQRIADESPASYLRDSSGVRVTLSPKAYHDKLQHWASNPDENPVVRFRALMNLGSDDAKKMLQDMEKQSTDKNENGSLGQGAKRFLQLILSMNDGDWQQANRLIDRLLRRGCGVSSFWEMKSDIESELGNATASLEALSKAIELEPLRMTLREKWLQRNIHTLTFNEYLEEFDRLLESDPDDKHLLRGRVSALFEGPDGKAFEKAAQECIAWFPRDPSAYGQLMQWYDSQGRNDLQAMMRDQAMQWMPDIFSDDDAQAAPDDEAKSGKAKSGEAFTADSPLPTDKEELLALVWKVSDPRRERALAEAVTMGREHRLAWFEYARVVACRVLLPENGADAKPAVTPSVCLPLNFPGAPHWFCETVSDIVTQYNSVLEIAKAVCDWMQRVVPDYEAYPSLWFQRVLLLENAREKELALQELKRMIERYPANSSALYRMGVVKYHQQDYKSSLHYADASLVVNPGLLGSLQLKRRLLEIIDDPDKYAETLVLLRKKLPYDFDIMQTQALELAKTRSLDELMNELKSVEADFPAKRFAVMRAKLFFDAGDMAKTKEILDCVDVSQLEAGGPDDSLLEDHFQLQLAIAEQSGNTTATLQVCEAGLKHWPDSTRLKEIKADCIAATKPKEAAKLLHETIVDGEPSARTVWLYISTSGKPAGQACLDLVGEVDESKQEELADLCDDVLAQPSQMHLRASFLESMLKRFPESNHLRWKLAGHLHLTGDLKRAVMYATQLHDRAPQEPEASRMLGRVLIDMNPKKALPHLEAACKKDRSVDYLFDLARCHQLVGNEGQSKTLHWEILDQNPFVAASWTNLYVFGESRQKLWPFVEPIIKAGRCTDDEYFLVAAVKLAIHMNRTLPPEWFHLAVVRYQMLHTYAGFRDERKELKNAMVAWMKTRPADKEGYTDLPSTGFGLYARFVWPKRAWIPVA